MNFQQLYLLFFTILLCCISCSDSKSNQKKETLFFPLLAWDDVRDESTIKKMAECGINLIAFTPPEFLYACEEHGVKAILFDERITPKWDVPYDAEEGNKALREIIELYNNHPAVYGYHLKDEPDGNQLPELGKSSRLVNELAPGKWAYINLPPGLGEWYDSTYVQWFVDYCDPKFISFDNYPIGESDKYGFSWGYWANLWDIRSASLRNNISFHTILLTAAHFSYRAPSFNDLALQIYGALAYGAQGLGYYKFVGETLHRTAAPDLGNWSGAPLDEFHDVNPIPYYNLRKINKRIQNMASVLLKLRSKDVYHIGGDSIPLRNHGVTESSLIQDMETGVAFIVGEFTHIEDNSEWLMIVNKNLKGSTFIRPKFADCVNPTSIKILSQVTGEFIDWPGVWYSLEPGQGVLLRLELKEEFTHYNSQR
jgi:hypothetical protein